MILEMKRSGDRFLWAAVIFGTLLGAGVALIDKRSSGKGREGDEEEDEKCD